MPVGLTDGATGLTLVGYTVIVFDVTVGTQVVYVVTVMLGEAGETAGDAGATEVGYGGGVAYLELVALTGQTVVPIGITEV